MKNTTPCGFCNGTGTEPGEANCIWCENTGIDWAGKPGDVPVVSAPVENPLRIALEHIQKTAGQSRTQTRRLRWIGKRAELALAGRPYVASEHELPVKADQEYAKLNVQAMRLRIERRDLQGRVEMLEGLLRRWLSRHAMGAGTDSMVIAESIAAVGLPALKPADGRNEPSCLLCLDKKTVPSNLAEGYVMDCPDCCSDEG